jgi:SSS family solute:Na+ symporter
MPEKFDMILSPDNPSYNKLPGIWILVGAGVWIGHFAYWGFNQYITQRALGAKSLKEAQKGVMFAAYLKLLMPFVIVLPGICAAVLFPLLEKSDQAYPSMMTLLPNGLLGLTFAALIAAIVSSLASMTNSVSTIFTMDVYKTFAKNNPSQSTLLKIGRSSALLSVVIAAIVAKPLLGSFERIFQYIQEFTGLFTPGILVIFLVALFWKKATTLSVLTAAITSVVLSIAIKIGLPELAYIHRMGVVFFMSGFLCYLTAMFQGMKVQEKAINLSDIDFSTTRAFNFNWVVITIILIITYIILG